MAKSKFKIIENHTLEQYDKRYGKSGLRKVQKKYADKDETLLEGSNWWLIDETYYELPKNHLGYWWKNLSRAGKVALCVLGVGAVTTAVVVPTVLAINHKLVSIKAEKEDSDGLVSGDVTFNKNDDGTYQGVVTYKDDASKAQVASIKVKVGGTELSVDKYSVELSTGKITINAGVVKDGDSITIVVVKKDPEPEVVHVTNITLNASSKVMTTGTKEKLVATVLPSNATNKNITWKSSSNAATVDQEGNVKAISAGTATITATTADGGLTATCSITINAPKPEVITINATVSGTGSDLVEEDVILTSQSDKSFAGNIQLVEGSVEVVDSIKIIVNGEYLDEEKYSISDEGAISISSNVIKKDDAVDFEVNQIEVAQIGEIKYTSLKEAAKAVTQNQTITLLSNNYEKNVNVAINCKIDINGFILNELNLGDGENQIPINISNSTSNESVGEIKNLNSKMCVITFLNDIRIGTLTNKYTNSRINLQNDTIKVTINNVNQNENGKIIYANKNITVNSFDTSYIKATGETQYENLYANSLSNILTAKSIKLYDDYDGKEVSLENKTIDLNGYTISNILCYNGTIILKDGKVKNVSGNTNDDIILKIDNAQIEQFNRDYGHTFVLTDVEEDTINAKSRIASINVTTQYIYFGVLNLSDCNITTSDSTRLKLDSNKIEGNIAVDIGNATLNGNSLSFINFEIDDIGKGYLGKNVEGSWNSDNTKFISTGGEFYSICDENVEAADGYKKVYDSSTETFTIVENE